MVDGFESKKDAGERRLKNITDIHDGRKRQHDHVGDLEKLDGIWSSKACLDYVNGLCDGTFLNFSQLAREYGLKESNCKQKDNKGQIVMQSC